MFKVPALIGTVAILACLGTAQAQQPADPRLAAATQAYAALPEAERKAIQADLIWTGHLNSAATGNFGPLTFRAVNGFKAGRGQPDGQLTPAERQELARIAKTARDAAGFAVITDQSTGVRIGIPQKLLPKREATPAGGSRWQSGDGKITLDVSAGPATEPLQAIFERAIAVNPNIQRKVTYKLLQPNFFVVAGETPTGKFFRRQALGPSGLRGFSVGYDKGVSATFDKVVTAIADSFEPFPSGAAPTPAAPGAPAVASVPAQPATERFGVGLVVGKELVLTARSAIDPCKGLKVGGRPAKLRVQDQASGLALLDVPGLASGAVPGLRDAAPAAKEAVVVLAYDGTAAARTAVALPGEVMSDAVLAPLQPGGAGSPVFDRQGRLAGLITANPSDKALIAGVAPQRNYAIASVAQLKAVLEKADAKPAAAPAGGELSTGAIAEAAGKSVVPVACGL
ncbi:trypsin-like peptidase domain-containing protein [Bosea sp. (in: a-proteobacteria)]|uniref:trypsin-like peptidase domain-containing protein n=1 Tax=Bosea sp. (in: a-proteobacteria) TaxID=1871050 RepID=UPI002DDCFE9E|nr:trypsin-like peptidase domain-containing protein [Bosea sp. (in: a-proteobacteria)]HEV2508556.1 trypsin-like peptidase domain-containing protein [Bosea sp. (in: a-proteobacteria)]